MLRRKLSKTIMIDSKIRKIDKDCRISREIRIWRETRHPKPSIGLPRSQTTRVVLTLFRPVWSPSNCRKSTSNHRSKALKWAKSRLSSSSHINQVSIRPTPPCIRNRRRLRSTIPVTTTLALKMLERATETPCLSITPLVPTESAPTTECPKEPANRSRKTGWAVSVRKDSPARSLTLWWCHQTPPIRRLRQR